MSVNYSQKKRDSVDSDNQNENIPNPNDINQYLKKIQKRKIIESQKI